MDSAAIHELRKLFIVIGILILVLFSILMISQRVAINESKDRGKAIRAATVLALDYGLRQGCERTNQTRSTTATAISDVELGLLHADPKLYPAVSAKDSPFGNAFDNAREQLYQIDCDLYVNSAIYHLTHKGSNP